MLKLQVVLVLFLAVVAIQAQVVDLTPDNFDSLVDGSRPAFIEFYAPWCGHCKKLTPEYEIAGNAFKPFSKNVLIARVDCDSHGDLCSRYDVSGYPTLKWFASLSDIQPYSQERTAEGIINFVNSKTGLKARLPGKAPSAVVELTASNFDSIVTSDVNAFVEFFAPWCGHCKSLAPVYEQFAKIYENEDVVVASVDCDANRDLCGRFDVGGYPTLKWFPAGSSEPLPYEGGRGIENFVEFVNGETGTQRKSDGRLDENSGILEEFKDLITSFKSSGISQTIISESANLKKSVANKLAAVYHRAFEKLNEDASYVENEIQRLQRMIEGGSLQSKKIDEFTQRINILNQFR